MTIRTRAFVGLWLLSILAISAIGFVVFSLNVVAARMDAERLRIAEILDIHGSMWRVLVELKNDQHYYALTGLTPVHDRIEQLQRSIADYLAHLNEIVTDPEQAERLQQLEVMVDRWTAEWAQTARARARRPRRCSQPAKRILRPSTP